MKRTLRVVALVLVAAVLIDRIALYAWGHAVLAFYQGLDASLNSPPAARLEDVQPPWIAVNPARGGGYTLDLALSGSGLNPEHVTLDESGVLTLLFLPPRFAWSTRIFPFSREHPSVTYYGYVLTVSIGAPSSAAEVHLYRSIHAARTPVVPASNWPHFF